MIKFFEFLAFALSVAAVVYGGCRFFRKGTPKYFQLYVFAAGCYMLEELWVIVNSFFGDGAQDGLVTVRLFGIFGCLCFMLSANAEEFDRVVDEGQSPKAKIAALLGPTVLLLLFAVYALMPENPETAVTLALGFFSISPALFAAYFSLKHLLLPADTMGFLKLTKNIDILALVFFAANYLYPTLSLFCSGTVMSFFDVLLAVALWGFIVLCERGAEKWKTLS